MKLIQKLICLSAVLCAFISCEKSYEMPPLNEPQYALPANAKTITIAELRDKYKGATQLKPLTITDTLWLKARVSANDESGNVYKQIILQDPTGGISFLVDQNSVFNDYPVGQEVFIDLHGLCVSVYGNEQQLGHPNGYLFRTPYQIFIKKVHKTGWADPKKVNIQTFNNFNELNKNPEAVLFNIVRLNNVKFADGGKLNFAETEGIGQRNLVDDQGNTIVVRTSNFANFAANKLPEGVGTVVAILGRFKGTWQLTIPKIDCVYGFVPTKNSSNQNGGNTSGEKVVKLPYSETFKSDQGKFTIEDKVLPSALHYVWKYDTRFGMKASAFKKPNGYATESWLISPEIDLNGASHPTLSFEHAGKYFKDVQKEATLMVKTEKGQWEQVVIPNYPTDFTYVTSTVDLTKYVGEKIQFAFKYTSTVESPGTWEIKNVNVK